MDVADAGLVAGRYRLERLVGRGGMAEVYLAADELLHRPVAVKLLATHLSADAVAVERFRGEARTAAGLTHPSVVAVYDFGEANGRPFLVMEYVPGQTLEARLLQSPHPSLDWSLPFIESVLDALAYAHAAGVVHRDVKPANVILVDVGAIKLADFGIAQALAAATITQTGIVLGSAHFIAPERLLGQRALPATDCYSVGVMLYQLATGRLPFDAESTAAIVAQQVNAPPIPPRRHRPSLPSWLEYVILRALEKDPSRRYADAAAMLADLHAGLYARPLPSQLVDDQRYGEPKPPAAGTLLLRHKLPLAVAAAAAVILILAGSLLFRSVPADAQPPTLLGSAPASIAATAPAAPPKPAAAPTSWVGVVSPPQPLSAQPTAPTSSPPSPPLSVASTQPAPGSTERGPEPEPVAASPALTTFASDGGGYELDVPEGWRVEEGDRRIAFFEPEGRAFVALSRGGAPGIRAPRELLDHTLKALRDGHVSFTHGDPEELEIAGQPALRFPYTFTNRLGTRSRATYLIVLRPGRQVYHLQAAVHEESFEAFAAVLQASIESLRLE
ncbi:MAG: protein kinase [Chloroflexi bacterium]|nr:protein kinase [Chloroflexota bacterium]